MSRVVVFCGESGTGKTLLAQAISKELNIFCLHKDALKERLYELEEGKTLEDSNRIGKQAVFLLRDLAEDAIKNGVDILLEAPFDHVDNVECFERWAVKYGARLSVIICMVDETTRQQRIQERPRHHSHHDEVRKSLGHFVQGNFDYNSMPGKKLFLKTDRPVGVLVDEVVEFLRS